MNKRKYLATLIAAALAASATMGAQAQTTSPQANGYKYSDTEVAAAMLFGRGPVTDDMDSVDTDIDKAAADAALEQTERFLIDEGSQLDGVLDGIRGGDVYQVEESAKSLQEEYVDYAEGQKNSEGGGLPEGDTEAAETYACGIALVCIGYAAVVLHNAVMVTAVAVSVVGVHSDCGVSKGGCGKSANTTTLNSENADSYQRQISELTKLAAK